MPDLLDRIAKKDALDRIEGDALDRIPEYKMYPEVTDPSGPPTSLPFAKPIELQEKRAVKELGKGLARGTESQIFGWPGKMLHWAAERAKPADIFYSKMTMPFLHPIADHLIKKYGPQKALKEFDKQKAKYAKMGEKWADYWEEQASKGWEAPDPEVMKAKWGEMPLVKTFAIGGEALPSYLSAIVASVITKNPQIGLLFLSSQSAAEQYRRQRKAGTKQEMADAIASLTGAWEYITEKIPFEYVLKGNKPLLKRMLVTPTLEAFQEFIQGIGENFLEHFGYTAKDLESVPDAVKEGLEHTMDGWVENVVGGGFVGVFGGGAGAMIQAHRKAELTDQIAKETGVPQEQAEAAAKVLVEGGTTEEAAKALTPTVEEPTPAVTPVAKPVPEPTVAKPTEKVAKPPKVVDITKDIIEADEKEKEATRIITGFDAPPPEVSVKEEESMPADEFQPALEKLVGENNWQLELNRTAHEKRTKQFKPKVWEAITLWIQYHNRPALLTKYEQRASPALRKTIARSRNLSKEELAAAQQLEKEYAADIKLAKELGVIEGFQEHYINQVWDIKKKGKRLFAKHRRFGATPTEAKQRIIKQGYLEGIFDAKLKPITLNAAELRRLYKEHLVKAINEKIFLNTIRDMTLPTGAKLLVPLAKVTDWSEYVVIDHPSLMRYMYHGTKVKKGKNNGAFGNTKAAKEIYFERMPLAVHRSAASKLRPILERSQLRSTRVIRSLLKFNAVGKYTLLSFSGFHHTALGKTAIFYGVSPLPWGKNSFRAGLDLIQNEDPVVQFLVEKGGLTLGTSSKLSFARDLSTKGFSVVGKRLGLPGKGIMALKRWWDRGLWDHYFVGLKAISAKMWFQKIQKLYPNKSRIEQAKIAANDINNNFGGLNWELLGVSDTALDWFRMALLAPDWSLSNWRMFFDASKVSSLENMLSEKLRKGEPLGEVESLLFGGGKHAKGATRYMGRVFFTLGLLTMAVNMALWGDPFPQDKKDKSRTWWMVKLPYKDEEGRPYYLDLFGHFFEPVKLASSPIRWAAGKRSFVWRGVEEQARGTNWRGDYIGNIEDLLMGDLYRSKYKSWPEPGLFGWKRMPNRIIHAGSSFIPIPLRAVIDISIGQKKPVESLSTAGLYIRRGRKAKKKGLFRKKQSKPLFRKKKKKSLFRKAG